MKYTIREKLAALWGKLTANRLPVRMLALLLALVLLQGDFMLPAYSAGEDPGETTEQGTTTNNTTVPSVPEQAEVELPVDEDTLVITLAGADTTAVELFPYEKVEICADDLEQQADYQWQIQHPETGAWINVYDATEQRLSISAALVKNMLSEDGTAALRCRAHTEEYAYLSDSIRVILRQDSSASATTSSTQLVSLDDPAVPLADGDATPEFVTVTIEYLQYDFQRDNQDKLILVDGQPILETVGKIAFTSYMATLHGGGELKTTVHFPTIVGYDSYWEDEKTPSTQHIFNEDSITQDLTYQVSYKPALVSYTVRYFFQNIYDDLYVEDSSKKITSKGYTGATPPDSELNAEVTGFTPLYYQPDSIAADSSTIFEVFYERNYYLMEFDCNEGYGAETVYVRYGSHISVPTPVRPGYVFGENGDGNGWDLVKTEQTPTPTLGDKVGDPLPATMPPYNSAYKAIWDTTQTTYTVVYWRENADDGYYSYWDTSATTAESTTRLVPLEVAKLAVNAATAKGLDEATYFTLNEAKTAAENPAEVIVQGDGSTIINVYYTRNRYTINFVYTGKCLLDEHSHTDDCYDLACGYTHIHNENCTKTLICTIPEHEVHTNDCLTCVIPEHAHSTTCSKCDKEGHVHDADCCNLDEHVHSTDCYSLSNGTWGAAYDGTPTGTTADNGIMRVESGWNNYYYYKIGDTWYQITGLSNQTWNTNYYANVTVEVCTKNVHSHGDGNCDYSSCALHVHTAECYKCGKLTHTHSTTCCTVEEHTVHTTACYTFTGATLGNAVTDDWILNSIQNNVGGNNQANNGIVRVQSYGGGYRYYYLIGSTWYQIQLNNTNWENVTVETCEKTIHTHGDGNCVYCTEEEHTHSNACMDCGLVAHTHTDFCYKDAIHIHDGECYLYSCGEDSHIHTDVCYYLKCRITEHTHTDNCNSSNRTNSVHSITAKYDSGISAVWEENPIKAYLDDGIVWQSSVTNKYYSFLEKMPNQNITMTHTQWSGNTYTWYYYLEVTPYVDTTNKTLRTDGGKTYYLYHTTSVQGSSISLTYEEDYFPITGYKQRDSSVPSFSNRTAYLYYTVRRDRQFTFYNRSDAGPAPETQNPIFNQPLKEFEITKDVMEKDYYPSVLEPGAYEFAGWYTSPGCYDGSEFDWKTATMPDANLEIYAKWTPILRNVIFYSAYSDIQKDKDDTSDKIYHFMKADNIPHGTELGSAYYSTPEWPQDLDTAFNGGSEAGLYDFVGWFYMDDNGKKRFAPDSMEITRDLVLFAEWQTSIDTTYEVQYVLAEDVSAENVPSNTEYSKGTVIADTISAHSTVGKTKTFNAKGGSDLYSDFQTSFFPTVNSHSILMEQDSEENKFTFEYVYDDVVYYKVRYVDYATRTELHTSKVASTNKAIVTEKFLPINNYLPQNYYITKALAYDGTVNGEENPDSVIDENIITFYYTKDTEHGLYSVEYYLENPDSTDDTKPENYYQYESIVGSDDKGQMIYADIRKYEGYTHVPSMNTVITYNTDGSVKNTNTNVQTGENDPRPYGTVDFTGLTIKIYYKRNSYPYIIEYREYGAAADAGSLKIVESTNAKFDTTVTHIADASFVLGDITYDYYIDDATEDELTKSMTIRVPVPDNPDTDEDETFENKLVFFYKKHEVTVHYVAVCKTPDATGFGGLSVYNERAATTSGLNGSNATPGSGFKFSGWYTDKECTAPVNSTWRYNSDNTANASGTKLIPGALDSSANNVYYYALFEPITTNLIIKKEGMTSNDTSLFRIEGQNKHKYLSLTVAISGNNSATIENIPIDEYKVTELTDWSWKYNQTSVSHTGGLVTLTTTSSNNEITFTNTYANPDWLGGESSVADNNFN